MEEMRAVLGWIGSMRHGAERIGGNGESSCTGMAMKERIKMRRLPKESEHRQH